MPTHTHAYIDRHGTSGASSKYTVGHEQSLTHSLHTINIAHINALTHTMQGRVLAENLPKSAHGVYSGVFTHRKSSCPSW